MSIDNTGAFMIKANKMTECSWLLQSRIERMGILRFIDNKYSIIGGDFPGEYADQDTLEKKLGDKIKFVEPKTDKTDDGDLFIEGYPIKHDQYFVVASEDELHTYVKREGSGDFYMAGYFCIQFKGKWQPSFCPRAKTLSEHKWLGPFKDKVTMDHTIRVENNR
jgi:hypothetical protein